MYETQVNSSPSVIIYLYIIGIDSSAKLKSLLTTGLSLHDREIPTVYILVFWDPILPAQLFLFVPGLREEPFTGLEKLVKVNPLHIVDEEEADVLQGVHYNFGQFSSVRLGFGHIHNRKLDSGP
jgi:hypothetical protein